MSRPSTMTLPAVGCRWPVIRLNRVDLPAPFGPITAAISPSATARSTSLTALKPPNDFDSPLTSSTRHLRRWYLGNVYFGWFVGDRDLVAVGAGHATLQPSPAGHHAAD